MGKRVILIVLDSVGIGEMPDAHLYGDKGSNTLGNIALQMDGLSLPNLAEIGLGHIAEIKGVSKCPNPKGSFGKMAERSPGKDTTTGHWELAGVVLEKAFPTFPNGFPAGFLEEFESRIGRGVIGNEVASGTEIIQRLGQEHLQTGKPIVYTSADSVFQVAAHEDIIPVPELMNICQIAREMLVGDMRVGRVIARPFIGKSGTFTRTTNRHDFAIEPPHKILTEHVEESGLKVYAVGKIKDIYAAKGISEHVPTKSNMEAVDKTLAYMRTAESGLIMSNLVDFDMLFGHRNDAEGYAKALEAFDSRIPELISSMTEDDMLIITADHGCDPTTPSTDHSREYVPLLVYGPNLKRGVDLGLRSSFSDVGASIIEYLGAARLPNGTSFCREVMG